MTENLNLNAKYILDKTAPVIFSEDPDVLDTYQYLNGQDIVSSVEEKQNSQINFWPNLKFWLKVKSKTTAEQIKTIGDQTETIKIQPNIFEPIFFSFAEFH